MKWFKHISDSLDDPFIFDLMTEFKSDGYVVFFGVIEIYSREFSPEKQWKLNVSLSFLHQKLRISSSKIKKILSKIHKWEVTYNNNQVSIFIPKFTTLLDEWTARKLGSDSGVSRKILSHELESDTDKDKYKESAPTGATPENSKEEKSKHYSKTVGEYLPRLESLALKFKDLPQKKIPFNPFQFIQKFINDGYHPEVILNALQKIFDYWPKITGSPYAYVKDFIYQDQKQKEAEGWKKITIADLAQDVQKGIAQLLSGLKAMPPPGQTEKERAAVLRKQAESLRNMSTEERLYV